MQNLRFIDAQAVDAAVDLRGLVEHLRRQHRLPPAEVDRVLLQQTPTADAGGGTGNAVLVWPAWQHGTQLGVKLVTVFPGNRDRPAVQGVYLLCDGRTGTPQAVIDGTALTLWKTAADSALAADYLARRDAATLLMVGAGALAPYLVCAHRLMRPGLRELLVWNRDPAKAAALAAGVDGIAARAVSDLRAAVEAADIVSCATASTTPLVRGAWLRPGCHVDLVGGFTPQMRETDDEVITRARVFVDSRGFTLDKVGDLCQPIAAGVVKADHVLGDLFDLCQGRVTGRGDGDGAATQITVFKSGGGAHLDLMAAQYIAARVAG